MKVIKQKIYSRGTQDILGQANFQGETIEEAREKAAAWVQQETAVNSWGRPKRWVKEGEEDVTGAIGSRPVGDEEDGPLEYEMPADFDVAEPEDITPQIQAEKEVADTRSDRQFCLDMIDEIATFNKGNATDEQVLTLFTDVKYVGIIAALLSGGGKPAKQLMALHGPALYPQEVVNLFVAKLDQRFPARGPFFFMFNEHNTCSTLTRGSYV